MTQFRKLTRRNLPRCYELSFDGQGETPTIVLGISKDFLRLEGPLPDNPPIHGEEFGFTTFAADFTKDFGFNSALKFRDQTPEMINLAIPMPLVRRATGVSCTICDGSGKEDFFDRDCMLCDGSGKEMVYDYREAYAISATMSLLTMLFRCPTQYPSSTQPQLLNVYTICQSGPHGGSLGGEYSIPLVRWLVEQGSRRSLPFMTDAMRQAWLYMMAGKEQFRGEFRAVVENDGWLNVSCPGDACGLNPDRYINPGDGYDFSCHNVDTPAQQLTLLAGLAALHDRVKKDISQSGALQEAARLEPEEV